MNPKDLILYILKNTRQKKILLEMYTGEISFTELKEKSNIDNNTTLSRDLDFLDSNGLIVNIFERKEDNYYSHYQLNHYGRRIAEIVKELDEIAEKRADEAILA